MSVLANNVPFSGLSRSGFFFFESNLLSLFLYNEKLLTATELLDQLKKWCNYCCRVILTMSNDQITVFSYHARKLLFCFPNIGFFHYIFIQDKQHLKILVTD